MIDVDLILGLLNAKADHSARWRAPPRTARDLDWTDKRPLYWAQALHTVVAEIRAALPAENNGRGAELRPGTVSFWVLLTEIGGSITATFFDDIVQATEARDRFGDDHGLINGSAPHGVCRLERLDVPPRRSPPAGALDGRVASIALQGGSFFVEFHETREKAEAALDELEDIHGDDALFGLHEILVRTVPLSAPRQRTVLCGRSAAELPVRVGSRAVAP